MANSIPHRVWLIDCDPNCPGGMIHDQPYTCEGCGEVAIEYGPASELREVLKALLLQRTESHNYRYGSHRKAVGSF